jgi:eukaryotic-like serine/threonine-protein kinase
MPDDAVISQFLDAILESGRTPEEVCPDDPVLLTEVRRRLRKLRKIEAQIDDLFPSSYAASSQPERAHLRNLDGAMPEIPGYEVKSILGYGGMGVVYKARHLKLNRSVAIKMLLAGVYASASERRRFLREAEAVAHLSHPNVVQLFDMGECNGFTYFTMEYVEGGTLAHSLKGVPWPSNQAAVFIRTIALAVQFAHNAGIVHRDLKPGNILLTSDGTPKINDFGLARRLDDEVNVTMSGVRIGTPCYMAPEQALGQTNNVGATTDVYALGAILYELLTGRPPFRAETTSETQRQLISQDPVPPTRLNSNVRRDLETICLTCLRKEPHRRYATATALAEDLDRFLRNEPIAARRTGALERSAKWMRRHPATTIAAVAVLLLVAISIAVGIWSAFERANLANAVNGDLNAMAKLQQQERWGEARAALGRAQAIVAAGGNSEVRQRCAQAEQDLDLAVALDQIRLTRATSGLLVVYRKMANEEYARLFAQAQLGTFQDSPKDVAARVNASATRTELVNALYDWAYCPDDLRQQDWVQKVVLAAAPDPGGWSQRILDPTIWSNRDALNELANKVPVDQVPLPLLLALGDNLMAIGRPAVPFLIRVQKQHPENFWVNLDLGNALLLQQAPAEARGYYRVALAQRPDGPVGYCVIGDTFRIQEMYDEAMEYYRKSIQLDPDYPRGYCNIGVVFEGQKNYVEAINYFNKSLQLDPKYAWAYFDLGDTLQAQGKHEQSDAAYQKAITLEPDNSLLLGAIHTRTMDRLPSSEEKWSQWHEIIETDPPRFDQWFGYSEMTLFLGKDDEYRRVRTAILKRFGDTTDPMLTEKIGRGCLLLPAGEDETRMAVALIDRALDARDSADPWLYPYFLFAKGLADYREDRFDDAISILQGNAPDALGPCPRLVMAMALYRDGKQGDARRILASAVTSYADWRRASATERDLWITSVVCREAENTILPNVPAFLEGKYRPRDNDERLALVAVCEDNSLPAAEAQLLADAFIADPALADDIHNGLRTRAACAAALAGAGQGKDGSTLDDSARAHWRDQARRWLQSDLYASRALLKQNLGENSDFVRSVVHGWQTNADMASIRDEAALQNLSPAERGACADLWTQVQAALTGIPSNVHDTASASEGKSVKLPFEVYSSDVAKPPYEWSGWMGDTASITIDPHCTDNPHSGTECMKLQFESAHGFGGIAAQSPPNDWGDRPGGYNLSGATRLTFWARGEEGGETVTFKLGILGSDKKYADSDHAELSDVMLTRDWKEYTIDLTGKNLSCIKTGFVWALNANGKPVTFCLDDIRYE